MPARTTPKGNFRFKRTFPGVGAIRRSANTAKAVEYRARDAVLTKLFKADRVDLLRDFKAKRLSIEELMDLDRRGELLRATAHDAITRRPLWDLTALLLPRMGKKVSTRTRYSGVLDRLKERGLLGPKPTLVDVTTAPWPLLRASWPGGPSDWNHVGRTLSRVLSLTFNSKHHPLRLAFMQAFPFEREVERMPDLDPETFHRVVAAAPEWLRPVYYCLVATGMRIEEFLACTEDNLLPATRQIRVPGHKTDRVDILPIAPQLWGWVTAAIPSPACYDTIRLHWKAAQTAAGVPPTSTLHDIRHLTGQFLSSAGLSDAQIGQFLRHVSFQSTRRYTKARVQHENAARLAAALGGAYSGASDPTPIPLRHTA